MPSAYQRSCPTDSQPAAASTAAGGHTFASRDQMPLVYAAARRHLHGTARRMARVLPRAGACSGDPSRGGGTAADLGSQGRWAWSTQAVRRAGDRVGLDVRPVGCRV